MSTCIGGDRLNADPATEYAVYIPASDSYVRDDNGIEKAFWASGSAQATADTMREYSNAEYEIHERLNYAVTPWRKVEP